MDDAAALGGTVAPDLLQRCRPAVCWVPPKLWTAFEVFARLGTQWHTREGVDDRGRGVIVRTGLRYDSLWRMASLYPSEPLEQLISDVQVMELEVLQHG